MRGKGNGRAAYGSGPERLRSRDLPHSWSGMAADWVHMKGFLYYPFDDNTGIVGKFRDDINLAMGDLEYIPSWLVLGARKPYDAERGRVSNLAIRR